MNKVWKVTRFQFYNMRIWSIVSLVIVLFNLFVTFVFSATENTGAVSSGTYFHMGFGASAFIMIFILGLNCFKGSFRFLLANGNSRKTFFFGNIPFLAGISCVWSAGMIVLTIVYSILLGGEKAFSLFTSNYLLFLFISFFGNTVLFFALASLGWLIGMIYYRSNTIMKIVVSLSPVALILLITWLNDLSGNALGAAFSYFSKIYIFPAISDPFGFIIFLIAAFLFCGLCWPLLRKAPIKD